MDQRFFRRDAFRRPAPLGERTAGAIAATETTDVTSRQAMHDPAVEPRDEAVFLLTAAAEIEHALMVQYLFAGYSIRIDDGTDARLRQCQELLVQIAREEMGHLATVQNLLLIVGGALSFGRENSPDAGAISPFRFKLEALTLDSLAKYVVAESPLTLPAEFPPDDLTLLTRIGLDARRANDGEEVRHVGAIYARLEQLFASELADEDFFLDTFEMQAKVEDWGFEPRSPEAGEKLILESFASTDIAPLRDAAVAAIRRIGAQGEGFDLPPAGSTESESHFERFLAIYKLFKEVSGGPAPPTWPLAESPNTTSPPPQPPALQRMVDAVQEAHASKGRITNPRARLWAQLFNLRYRMLLTRLSHFLRLDQPLYVDEPAQLGDRTARGFLLIWTFDEMRRLKRIATKLVQLPKDDPPGDLHAGPPFELPYTLNLSDREPARWRAHLDASRAAVRLVREKLQPGHQTDADDPFLADLVRSDEAAQLVMHALASGRAIPSASFPTDFEKTVLILEEAVRGFSIGGHGGFWRGRSRDAFVTESPGPLVGVPIKRRPDGSFDADQSRLVQRIAHTVAKQRMPRFRPAIPEQRIRFVHEWIAAGCKDNEPAGQPSFSGEPDPSIEPLPPAPRPPETPLSFAADIRPLFRQFDRDSMITFGGFDLHRFEDARDNAEAILERIEDGTMPCDGSWPRDRIEKLRDWILGGKQP